MNINKFKSFANENYLLEARAGKMTDTARKNPIILAKDLFLGIVYSVVFFKRSLLQLEHTLRKGAVKKLFGSKRKMVSSDCTYWRVLPHFVIDPLRKYLYVIYVRSCQKGLLNWSIEKCKKFRVGIMDGSMFGKHYAVAFQALGERTSVMVDLEPTSGRGKELPAAQTLLKRLVDNLGKNFVDLILLDALYEAQNFINYSLSVGIDVLIKTREVSLNVIQDAEGIFNNYEQYKDQVEYAIGYDAIRERHYEIWAACCFKLTGVDKEVKVARVREEYKYKGKEVVEDFWIITTRIDLTVQEMRELAHRRWSIENNGFKAMNAQSGSKHTWARDAKAFEVQMLMRFVGFNLFELYVLASQDDDLGEEYEGVQRTMRFYSEILWESLLEWYFRQGVLA